MTFAEETRAHTDKRRANCVGPGEVDVQKEDEVPTARMVFR